MIVGDSIIVSFPKEIPKAYNCSIGEGCLIIIFFQTTFFLICPAFSFPKILGLNFSIVLQIPIQDSQYPWKPIYHQQSNPLQWSTYQSITPKRVPLKLQNNTTDKAKPTKTTTKHQKPNTQTHQDNTKFLKTSKDPWNLTKTPTLSAQNPGLLRQFMRPKHHNRLRGVAAHRETLKKRCEQFNQGFKQRFGKRKKQISLSWRLFFGLKNKQTLLMVGLNWIKKFLQNYFSLTSSRCLT